jgi:hypothetical protein
VKLGILIVSTSIHDDDDVIEYTTDPELIFEKWQNLVDLVIDGGMVIMLDLLLIYRVTEQL